MLLLQEISSASNLFLTTKETVIICCGAVSVAIGVVTNNLVAKFRIKEVATKNEADHALAKQRVENIEKELMEVKNNFEALEKNIGRKLDDITKGLQDMAQRNHEMAIGFADFKTEMTKFFYEKK